MEGPDGASEQGAAAQQRVRARNSTRDEQIRILARPGGIALADSPARIAKRLDRVTRYYAGEQMPAAVDGAPAADAKSLVAAAQERVGASSALPLDGSESTEVLLERIINNSEFLELRYLEAGARAGRAVGRVILCDERRCCHGYGTGSLVSPRLLLTNHHVLPDAPTAARCQIEFDFQDDIDGQPLLARRFDLDPESLFIADRERDFTLVAVSESAERLAEFGYNRLISAEGKAIIGEYVTIVQHPRGDKKRVALRQEQIVDIPDATFLHYMADTEPGSSGSPVFNDQWEIIALHHASVRSPAASDFGGYVNEGTRVSAIIDFLSTPPQPLPASEQALVDELLTAPPSPDARRPERPRGNMHAATTQDGDGWVRITVPLDIQVRIGGPSATPADLTVAVQQAVAPGPAPAPHPS